MFLQTCSLKFQVATLFLEFSLLRSSCKTIAKSLLCVDDVDRLLCIPGPLRKCVRAIYQENLRTDIVHLSGQDEVVGASAPSTALKIPIRSTTPTDRMFIRMFIDAGIPVYNDAYVFGLATVSIEGDVVPASARSTTLAAEIPSSTMPSAPKKIKKHKRMC